MSTRPENQGLEARKFLLFLPCLFVSQKGHSHEVTHSWQEGVYEFCRKVGMSFVESKMVVGPPTDIWAEFHRDQTVE